MTASQSVGSRHVAGSALRNGWLPIDEFAHDRVFLVLRIVPTPERTRVCKAVPRLIAAMAGAGRVDRSRSRRGSKLNCRSGCSPHRCGRRMSWRMSRVCGEARPRRSRRPLRPRCRPIAGLAELPTSDYASGSSRGSSLVPPHADADAPSAIAVLAIRKLRHHSLHQSPGVAPAQACTSIHVAIAPSAAGALSSIVDIASVPPRVAGAAPRGRARLDRRHAVTIRAVGVAVVARDVQQRSEELLFTTSRTTADEDLLGHGRGVSSSRAVAVRITTSGRNSERAQIHHAERPRP